MRALRIGSVVALAAFLMAVPWVLPSYPQTVVTQVLIFALFAMSIDILAGVAGRTPLCHGALFGTAAYVVAYHLTVQGGSPWGAAALGVLGATLLATVFAALAVRTSGVYFLLLTLAEGMIVWGICYRWTSVTGAENGLRGIARPPSLEGPAAFYYCVLAVVVVLGWAIWRFVHSPFGLTLRGIKESETRMRTLGYDVGLHLLVGFAVSGFFAGAAGVLYAFFNSFVSPTTVSLAQSTAGLLMVIVGGVGTLLGAPVGAALIIVLENVVSFYTERWSTVLGLLFILTMLFAPEGVVGKLRSWSSRRSPVEPKAASAVE